MHLTEGTLVQYTKEDNRAVVAKTTHTNTWDQRELADLSYTGLGGDKVYFEQWVPRILSLKEIYG